MWQPGGPQEAVAGVVRASQADKLTVVDGDVWLVLWLGPPICGDKQGPDGTSGLNSIKAGDMYILHNTTESLRLWEAPLALRVRALQGRLPLNSSMPCGMHASRLGS